MFGSRYSRVGVSENASNSEVRDGVESSSRSERCCLYLDTRRGKCQLFMASVILGIILGWISVRNSSKVEVPDSGSIINDETTRSPKASNLDLTLAPTNIIPTNMPTQLRTNQPTLTPTVKPSTFSPSQPPSSSPTTSFKNYAVSNDVREAWKKFDEDRNGLVRGKSFKEVNNEKYFEFCEAQKNQNKKAFQIDVDFPPTKDHYSGNKLNIAELREHIQHFQAAMANFYHYETVDEMDFGVDVSETSIKRIAQALFGKLKSFAANPKKNPFEIIYGLHGTSVLSGMDNCYYYTLAPLLGRLLDHLFAPIHAKIDIRNHGQNGANAPDMASQLLCSQDTLGDLDFLHLWYPMIPAAPVAVREAFIRSWFASNPRLAQVTMADEIFQFDNFAKNGFISRTNWYVNHQRLNWFSAIGETWGLKGDGFCRPNTREGAVGILYQNWHLGPMGHQFIADGLVMLIAKAAELALNMLEKGDKPPNLPPLPSVLSTLTTIECEGRCARKQCGFDYKGKFYGSYMCDKTAPPVAPVVCAWGSLPQFKRATDLVKDWSAVSVKDSENIPQATWKFVQSKSASTIHSALEKDISKYKERPECSEFADNAFSFKIDNMNGMLATEWLELTWTNGAKDRLKGKSKMRVLVCNGQRYPLKVYKSVFPQGWGMETRIDNKRVSDANMIGEDILYGCISPYNREFVPVPNVGSKIGFRFRRMNTTADDPTEAIMLGTVLFFGFD